VLLRALYRTLELYASGIVLLGAIKAVKLACHRHRAALGPLDHASWAGFALVLGGGLALAPSPAAVPIVLLGFFLFVGLWLDALLYRVFTIELGPGGVGSIVVAVLYHELAELDLARRFWRENRVYTLLPLAALVALTRPLLTPGGAADLTSAVLLAMYLVLVMAVVRPVLWRRPGTSPHLRTFLWARALPLDAGFVPRREHLHLVAPQAAEPPPSTRHGSLAGASVLLITVESLSRRHARLASLPTLTRLAAGAVSSARHFCISPTTNGAHFALHFGAYGDEGESAVARLASEGLATVYVTPIHTSLYGLRRLLDRAGFATVIDAEQLAPRAGHQTLDDWVLADQGVAAIAAAARGGRYFAHVHTSHTHVPYRVAEERFRRRTGEGDRGRFLDGLEEADAVVAALLAALEKRGLLDDTLVVVSGDHGQSFGEFGYWSHGSAITAEQVDVPLLLAHPRLAAFEVEASSHFDVLPTVCDLLGVPAPRGLGASLFLNRPAELFLWAGQPSRGSTSCFGLVHERRKWLVDVVTQRCLTMSWDDAQPVELQGEERRYWQALCSSALLARGLK